MSATIAIAMSQQFAEIVDIVALANATAEALKNAGRIGKGYLDGNTEGWSYR